MFYDIWTDHPPETLTDIGLAIYAKWLGFALGKETLNGKRIKHPTGRYASSIFFRQESPTKIAIFADESIAPEAEFIEHGHRSIDLKRTGLAGRTIPLHRGEVGAYGSAGYGPAIVSSAAGARAGNVWAVPKSQGMTGFRRVPRPENAKSATAWVIPAMTAMEPAKILSDLIHEEMAG